MDNNQNNHDEAILRVLKNIPSSTPDQDIIEALQESLPGYDLKHIEKLIRTIRPDIKVDGIHDTDLRIVQNLKKDILDTQTPPMEEILFASDKSATQKEKKTKNLLKTVFGEYFLRCLFISIAVAVSTARFFHHPIYYVENKQVSVTVYNEWSKHWHFDTRMDSQNFDYVSGIIYGVSTFIICTAISKIKIKQII